MPRKFLFKAVLPACGFFQPFLCGCIILVSLYYILLDIVYLSKLFFGKALVFAVGELGAFHLLLQIFDIFIVMGYLIFIHCNVGMEGGVGFFRIKYGISQLLNADISLGDVAVNGAVFLFETLDIRFAGRIFRCVYEELVGQLGQFFTKLCKLVYPHGYFKGFLFLRKLNELCCLFRLLF